MTVLSKLWSRLPDDLAHVVTKYIFQYDRVMRQLRYGRRRRHLESFHEQYDQQAAYDLHHGYGPVYTSSDLSFAYSYLKLLPYIVSHRGRRVRKGGLWSVSELLPSELYREEYARPEPAKIFGIEMNKYCTGLCFPHTTTHRILDKCIDDNCLRIPKRRRLADKKREVFTAFRSC
eukprot:COSAG01_NODE_2339_length_7871_cov_114.127123_7_plen_175_part_00